MTHLLYPLVLNHNETEELTMKLFVEMVMMTSVRVVDMMVFDLVHYQELDFVDDYQDKTNVVLLFQVCVDKMYLDVIHLHVDVLVVNKIIANELNDTRK
jgi:hypothetical protein